MGKRGATKAPPAELPTGSKRGRLPGKDKAEEPQKPAKPAKATPGKKAPTNKTSRTAGAKVVPVPKAAMASGTPAPTLATAFAKTAKVAKAPAFAKKTMVAAACQAADSTTQAEVLPAALEQTTGSTSSSSNQAFVRCGGQLFPNSDFHPPDAEDVASQGAVSMATTIPVASDPHEEAHTDPDAFLKRFYIEGTQQVDMSRFLRVLADHMLDVVEFEQGRVNNCCCLGKLHETPGHWSAVSLCTGSGIGELVTGEYVRALSDRIVSPITLQVPMVSEVVEFKQQNLMKEILRSHPTTCCFADCSKIGQPGSFCVRHKAACAAERNLKTIDKTEKMLNLLVAGFSCKNFSHANVDYAALRDAVKNNRMDTTSVRTFWAVVNLLEQFDQLQKDADYDAAVDVFVLENVDSIGDEMQDGSNLQAVIAILSQCCNGAFIVRAHRVWANHYGLPQARLRVYIVGIRRDSTHFVDANKSSQAISELLPKLRVPMIALSSLVEPADSTVLSGELARRMMAEPVGISQPSSGNWVAEHMLICEKKGISWPVERPLDLVQNDWFQTHSAREQEQIVFGRMINDPFTNSTQSAARNKIDRVVSHRPRDVVATLLPGSHFWCHDMGRPFIGHDMLALQGLPQTQFLHLSESQKADLAGNSFASPCFLAVLIAIGGQIGTTVVSGDTWDPNIDLLMRSVGLFV